MRRKKKNNMGKIANGPAEVIVEKLFTPAFKILQDKLRKLLEFDGLPGQTFGNLSGIYHTLTHTLKLMRHL